MDKSHAHFAKLIITYHILPFLPNQLNSLWKKNQTCDVDILHQQCVLLVIMHAELYKVVRYMIYINSTW